MTDIQITFTKEALHDLTKLAILTNAKSKADVVRNAVKLFKYAIEETKQKGAKVIFEYPDKSKRTIKFDS